MTDFRIPLIAVGLVAAMGVSGCFDGGGSGSGPGPGPDPMQPRALSEIVADEIDDNTNETAEPIQINDLMFEDDRSETADPTAV